MRKLKLGMQIYYFFSHKGVQAPEQVPREHLGSLGDSKTSTGQGPEQPDLVEPALGGMLEWTSRHPFQISV